jgi:poly(beta-D-mannuronate) lyase
MRIIFTLTFILLSLFLNAKNTTVNTLSQLQTTFSASVANDTITIANGTYNWGQINLVNTRTTSTSAWIVVKAQTPLGVTFTGSTYLEFSGKRILITGFRFTKGNSGTNAIIAFRSSSSVLADYCRVSNIRIDNYNTPDSAIENEWVAIYGIRNRLDHCSFINKSNARATVVVWYSTATFPAKSTSTYHIIDSNAFVHRSYMGGNGGESLRVGVGNNSRTDGYNIIEYNLFEDCIQTEPEIVSNKSARNIYRYNTFHNCNGGLTLRMGKYSTVYSNFFINSDPTKTGSYGIRIIDKGHTVFNNYCEGLLGTSNSTSSMRCPIVIYNGSFATADSLNPLILNGAYLPADSAVVIFNTIVNCPGGPGIRIGHTDNGAATNQPKGLKISNNLIKMSSGQAAYKDSKNTTLTYTAEGNRYSAPNGLGLASTTGFTNTTLSFSSRANGILTAPVIIKDASINTSKYTSTLLGLDIQGQTRSSIYDVGCDEINGSGLIKATPVDTIKVGSSSSIIT